MAVNLLTLLENEFSGDALSKVATLIGETPAKTQHALGNAIPAVVCMLNQKAQTTQGAGEVLGMMERGSIDDRSYRGLGNVVNSATGLADLMKIGAPLVTGLFAARQTGLIDWLSNSTGVGKPAASSLLALATPVVLGLVARQASSSGGFTASSLAHLLTAQGPFLGSVAPAGLAPVLGVSQCGEPVRVAEPARAYTPPPLVPEPRRGASWLWLIPLLLIPLLYFGWRGLRTEPPREVATASPTPAPRPAPAVVLVKRTLACGQTLDVAENGVETRLIGFIDDRARPVDQTTWFTFDRLEFETGSATLRPTSQPQLRNVAEIMRCYKNVDLKIGGYTDSVGDEAANLKLSDARAQATMRALIALDIPASRLSAEGYGEQHPVASNDTEEGRQRNRRIDIR